MTLYPVFLLVAAATVLSPGPGVVMTLTNALRYGFRGTFGGILGISAGALVVATLSATGLGVLLATSAMAFTVLKYAGAAYLIYLGVRLWKAPPFRFEEPSLRPAGIGRRFLEGLTLQITNPKAIFFFLSVFPQFIDRSRDFGWQFAGLVLTYGGLVIAIHCAYALTAERARRWLASERGGRAANRVGGAAFVCFGAALATARRVQQGELGLLDEQQQRTGPGNGRRGARGVQRGSHRRILRNGRNAGLFPMKGHPAGRSSRPTRRRAGFRSTIRGAPGRSRARGPAPSDERRFCYGLAPGIHRALEPPGSEQGGSRGDHHGAERRPPVVERRVQVPQRRRYPAE